MSDNLTVYIGAGLFNGRETYFNSLLAEGLEKRGYQTFLPQRDGFEFGNLACALSGRLEQDEIEGAVQDVIYFLDMGSFIPRSDVLVANWDEPIDEGLAVEASYARLMNKTVIGFRTDVRSPYGSPSGRLGGMHCFPARQADYFLLQDMASRTPQERQEQMDELVQRIDATIDTGYVMKQDRLPPYVRDNPRMRPVLDGADVLFGGIDNLHSSEGIDALAARYVQNKDWLAALGPRCF